MIWWLATAGAVAAVPAGLRWLRVAQREHYLPLVTRFAWRWWISSPLNLALLTLGLAGVAGSLRAVWPGFLVALAHIGPVGLSVQGRSSPLAWTARLRRVAILAGLVVALALVGGAYADQALVVAIGLFAIPVIIDLALFALAPVEKALGSKWVDKAARKLAAVRPEVVAVTGSYGKTTTKGYIAHLLSGRWRVLASPASFNNRMGLARAINENLTPGTQVFVAEMGTYGPGEIAEMCSWIRPKVGALVSVGPVHLERFKSEARVVAAKAEILDQVTVRVVCIDHPLLERLVAERPESTPVIEVSTGDVGSVRVNDGLIWVADRIVAPAPEGIFASNLAVAIGVALGMGLGVEEVVARLDDLPVPEHRQTVTTSGAGFTIIDDTFNANPAGARRALHLLATYGGSRAVITPGMVELGPRQATENENFSAEAAALADHLVIVGRTNRKALLRGAEKGKASVTVVDSREEAVAWARANLGPGDAVLYENDLPDHYP